MTDEERILMRHLQDLSDRAEQSGIYSFSGFLSLPEQDLLMRSVREFGFGRYRLDGGYEGAERRIAVFGSEDELGYPPELPLAVLSITPRSERYAEPLSHRDILGAVMSLQIDRSLTGDILVRGNTAYLICLKKTADFLCENLLKIRHTDVFVRRCPSDLPALQPVFQEVAVNIASERLDSIVAGLTGISRSHVERLFKEQRVFLNGRVIDSLSARPKEGDILTVRGFGKAIYCGISGTSKKGRLYAVLRKYV